MKVKKLRRISGMLNRLRLKVMGRKSTLEALAEMVKLSDLEIIVRRAPDRRALVRSVARACGADEEQLTKRVADKLHLPYLARVGAVDTAAAGEALTAAECRRCGVIPLMADGLLGGLVCVDPQLAGDLRRRLQQPPLYLASWSSISRALDESELRPPADSGRHPVLAQALGLLAEEALRHGARELEIVFEEQRVVYGFTAESGRAAHGEVHASLRPALEQRLRAGGLIALPDGNGALRAAPGADPGRFRLIWEGVERQDGGQEAASAARAPVVLLPGTAAKVSVPPAPCALPEEGREGGYAGAVLVIDDNPVFLNVVQRFFERHKIEAETSTDSAASLERLRSCGRKPALIVCDLHMPGINGADFLRRLRAESELCEIPVVILTSDREIEAELELVQLGADAFITKDQDPRLLCAQVERLLRRRGVKRAAA